LLTVPDYRTHFSLLGGDFMGDWISDLEKKKADHAEWELRFQKEFLAKVFGPGARHDTSYEDHKAQVDAVYDALEAYIKRAAAMGYVVVGERTGHGFTITKPNHSPKGYTEVYIRPEGSKLAVTFDNYGHHERRYRYRRVDNYMIGEWIKWVVEGGFKGPPPK
jgi:hypothetical protein